MAVLGRQVVIFIVRLQDRNDCISAGGEEWRGEEKSREKVVRHEDSDEKRGRRGI